MKIGIDGINRCDSDIIKNAYLNAQREENRDFASILEKAAQEKDKKRLKEACRDLEAVFINIVFERMRATLIQDGLIKKSLGEDIFTSMLDDELAREVAKGEGIGIADVLYGQLSKNIEK